MPHHKHISENDRLKQYLESILFYVTMSNFSDIVFIDWSWFDLKVFDFIKNIAYIYQKNIEFLSFHYDTNTVVNKWKGYWENVILEYGLDNSNLLNNFNCFYKVTWRYQCKNINSILKVHEDKKNIFIKNLNKTCNTAFFKLEKDVFKKYFVWAGEKVNDNKWICMEHIYYNIIRKNNLNIDHFSILPKFSWFSWWWGNLDKPYYYELIKTILNNLGFLRF